MKNDSIVYSVRYGSIFGNGGWDATPPIDFSSRCISACTLTRPLPHLQSELKLHVRLQPDAPPLPIRVIVNDEQGYDLSIGIYREVLSPSGNVILDAITSNRESLHGQLAMRPYENKDYLQLKRYQVGPYFLVGVLSIHPPTYGRVR